jgi:Plant mobile domain
MERDPGMGPVLRGRRQEEDDDEDTDDEELLVEEREADMVSFLYPDKAGKRKAWFLMSTGNVSKTTPLVPSNYRNPSIGAIEDPKFQFKGWCSSPRQWEQWVAKLLPKFGQIWKKVGIFDAILISTYRIRRDPSSILAIISHWCEETNTFLFPWGEVTITLEDIIILSGLSVLGDPVRAPLPDEMREFDSRLNEERLKFNRSTSKKAHHSAWMKVFMERDSDDLEHSAFLSLWLSRFVFPCHPEMTIRPHVFPIAIRLSYGQRIALAPSVLASIYRDLREMKRYLLNRSGGIKDGALVLWAPFHILQIWIWERFPGLRPETQNLIKDGEPRAARWHDVGKKLDLGLVQSVLSTPNAFHYRPYAISSSNWYKEGCDELIRDDELRSFAQCLCTCELVGVDTIEQYLPNRVAMQFGFDQDLPDPFSRVCNLGWEAAWRTYEITADNIGLYVPPQPFEPGVTASYLSWWREYMLPCCNAGIVGIGAGMPQVMVARENSKGKSKSGNKKARVSSPGDKKRKIQDCYDSTVSDCSESKVRDIHEIGTNVVRVIKGAKSLNHHLLIEETKDTVTDGSESAPGMLNQAVIIMERGGDLPSQVSGSVGDGKGVGFLEMKSITGDILKKLIKEDAAIKQEKVN